MLIAKRNAVHYTDTQKMSLPVVVINCIYQYECKLWFI